MLDNSKVNYWKALSCIALVNNADANAFFYKSLSNRINKNEQELLANLVNSRPKDLLRYHFLHPDWDNRIDWIDEMIDESMNHEIIVTTLLKQPSLEFKEIWYDKLASNVDLHFWIVFELNNTNLARKHKYLLKKFAQNKGFKYHDLIIEEIISKDPSIEYIEIIEELAKVSSLATKISNDILNKSEWQKILSDYYSKEQITINDLK